jgi:nitroimidazol reductase NimA-like FMN-containing flavoprotein (pyridoxamine 5'-phosphate oxidase superfamily)
VTAAEVPDYVVDYLDQQKTLTLASTGAGGAPHAATLVYVNEGPVLYVWLRQSAVTAGFIRDNPDVAFAIDQYAEDWRQTKGVQGTGRAEPVTDGEELARAADLFGQRFPDLRPGATSAVTFFRITPTELQFIDNSRGEGDPDPDEYRRESVIDGGG